MEKFKIITLTILVIATSALIIFFAFPVKESLQDNTTELYLSGEIDRVQSDLDAVTNEKYKYEQQVVRLKDSVQMLSDKNYAAELLIQQLNTKKNAVKKIDYSNFNDAELSSIFAKRYAKEDSLH